MFPILVVFWRTCFASNIAPVKKIRCCDVCCWGRCCLSFFFLHSLSAASLCCCSSSLLSLPASLPACFPSSLPSFLPSLLILVPYFLPPHSLVWCLNKPHSSLVVLTPISGIATSTNLTTEEEPAPALPVCRACARARASYECVCVGGCVGGCVRGCVGVCWCVLVCVSECVLNVRV